MRYLAKGPLCTKKLDNLDFNSQIHFDQATKLFFVANKNESTCQYYYFNNGHEVSDQYDVNNETPDGLPALIPLSSFEGQSECQGMSFVPRRCIDSQSGELVRALRFNGKQAEFITFKLPKRFGVVPMTAVVEPEQITYKDWAEGNLPKDRVYKNYVD